MASESVETHLALPYEALAEALADMGADRFMALVKAVNEKLADWSLIASLKPWVDAEHREMIQEETEDQVVLARKCVRSAEYEDIWVHANPHRGCVLR